MSDLPKVSGKIPLALAASDLAVLMNRIDNMDHIDEALISVFGTKLSAVRDAVDRRIMFHQLMKHTVESAKEMKDEWTNRVRILEATLERFKENTIQAMEIEASVQYDGSLGKLAIQRSPEALELSFVTKTFHVGDVVQDYDLSTNKIDPEFLTTKSFTVLKKSAVKEALQRGFACTWAKITQGRHLRVRV